MATPLHASVVPADDGAGAEGAKHMGFEPMPVQKEIWSLLEAKQTDGTPLFEMNAVTVPRRAGKTDALLALSLGRCLTVPDTQAAFVAQDGLRTRERFNSLVAKLRRHSDGEFRVREARGEERLIFANGSLLRFPPTKASGFRGDTLGLLVLDEAQEVEPEEASRIVGAVLPTMDTRDDAQLVICGTAGAERSGLLWDALEAGHRGAYGLLQYAAREDADPDDEATWLAVHPGPAGVEPTRALEVLRKRHAVLSPENWAREYLGIWPDRSTVPGAFSDAVWEACGAEMPPRPERFALAFDVTPSGDRASVVAVWRDGPHLWAEVLRDEQGARWLPAYAAGLAMKYRLPVSFDTAGLETLAAADEIARTYRRVTLKGLTTLEFGTACTVLSAAILAGTFRHSRQPALSDAVANAARRPMRDGGWAWSRRSSSGSIASLVAVTVGVKAFDSMEKPSRPRLVTATAS